MRKGETFEQEKARKTREAEALALHAKIPDVLKRASRLSAILQQLVVEHTDSVSLNLRPCRCGRQWTRLQECSICLGEKLK